MASNLIKRGFLSLIASQFFGAMNDNILKGVLTFMVVNGLWKGELGKDGGAGYIAIIFTVPFILLSGYGGQVADRFSKRSVLMAVKIAEIPIAMVGMIGFWIGNLWLTLVSLVLLTCQSAFFGPAKYGMIPELVDDTELSRANGTINMMTNIAVIIGTLASGIISDAYFPAKGVEIAAYWLPGTAMTLVAIFGLVAALYMKELSPGDRDLQWDWNPFRTYVQSVKEMSKTKLLLVMLAWGYFYLLAGIALLIVPDYTNVLKIDNTEASILLGVMGVAIGIGCAIAGLVSGDRIETRLIPVGALGLIFFFTLLGVVTPSLPNMPKMIRVACSNVSLFIFGAGFCAGFYIVPLQALLQKMSPDDERGRILATANACSFTFLAIASVIFEILRPQFGDQPQHMFVICALLMVAAVGFFLWKLRGTGILIGKGIADANLDPDEESEIEQENTGE